jgi:hypothetical protein
LIALGAAAILDNVFSHWLFGLHRAAPGDWATPVEIALAIAGFVMIGLGLRRELQARIRRARADRA